MSVEEEEREKLIESLKDAERESSTWTILFHQALADQVKLNITDHKCLDILGREGPLTAGQVADITGLTTGAVTGVIDRLEQGGYVWRDRDPNDRRRVIVKQINAKVEEKLGPLFGHFNEQLNLVLKNYTSDELALLLRFNREGIQVLKDAVTWLREKDLN
jgi:DNA-binding MarR family transcriptional regulator